MRYQQGDVLLKNVEVDLSSAETLKHLVLAEGEVTGHCHRITQGQAKLMMLKNIMYLKVISDYAKLFHDEHGEIDVPNGIYEVGRVKEYDHFEEEASQVRD